MASVILRFGADDHSIHTSIGTKKDGRIRVRSETGCGLFGPYVTLPAGRCIGRIIFDGPKSGSVRVDICAEVGKISLGSHVFNLGTLSQQFIELPIELANPAFDCEVRLFCKRDVRADIVALELEFQQGPRSEGAEDSANLHQWGIGSAASQSGWRLSLQDLVEGSRAVIEGEIMRRCLVSYLGDHTALCRILGRFVGFVDTRDVGFATHLMMRGIWEMGLTQFMVRTVKPGMRVADIGANFGYYSLLLSDLVTHTGHCFAFEPNPRAATLLRQSLSVNGFDTRSSVLEIALNAEARDAMIFYVPNSEPKNARLVGSVSDVSLEEGKVINVQSRSFTDMLPEIGPIDFIKIDVEGAEFGILTGMLDFIRQSKPKLVAEINFGRSYDARDMLRELTALYGSMKYVHDDGYAHDVSLERLSTERIGSDWLIYFG